MMLEEGPAATGGSAGPSMQPADMPMVADQTSPPRKQLRQDSGGSGQDLSAIHAGGNPIAQSHENMAEETTVERVTRRSARYQPQATVLRQEIFELQNALQNNRYYAVEEINQYKAHFADCARTYEAETRETSSVEVAQAIAPIASGWLLLLLAAAAGCSCWLPFAVAGCVMSAGWFLLELVFAGAAGVCSCLLLAATSSDRDQLRAGLSPPPPPRTALPGKLRFRSGITCLTSPWCEPAGSPTDRSSSSYTPHTETTNRPPR
jgi:hypothetical protein